MKLDKSPSLPSFLMILLLGSLQPATLLGQAGPIPSPEAQVDPPIASRIDWLERNAVPLAHVAPGSTDLSDLEPLREAIGDARVVLLGEQSHGDGTVFLTKARLIEFLHREMGFDVLAFESGLYELDRAWREIDAGRPVRSAMRGSIFSIWTGSEQFRPTIEYVERSVRTSRPLELAGVDLQFTGRASRANLLTEMDSVLRVHGSDLTEDDRWPGFGFELQRLVETDWAAGPPQADEFERFWTLLDAVRREFGRLAETGVSRASFWRQVVEGIREHALTQFGAVGAQSGDRQAANRRDRRMGTNLVWLANEVFPERKIIVWAATFHIVREVDQIDGRYGGVQTMGEVACEILGDDCYAIGFIAHSGSYGSWMGDARRLTPPIDGSLEYMFDAAGFEDAFLDFRRRGPGGDWLDERIHARPLGYGQQFAEWPRHLDGIIFNRLMEPSTPAAAR